MNPRSKSVWMVPAALAAVVTVPEEVRVGAERAMLRMIELAA